MVGIYAPIERRAALAIDEMLWEVRSHSNSWKWNAK
jgi:hypothetical protein